MNWWPFGGSSTTETGPLPLHEDIEKRAKQYLDDVDNGKFVYPACKRVASDSAGDEPSICDHTRLEAFRYLLSAPRREFTLLADPDQQAALFAAVPDQVPLQQRGMVGGWLGVGQTLGIVIGSWPQDPDLASLPVVPDIVDVFRRGSDIPSVIDDVVAIGAKTIWVQLGIWNEEAAIYGESKGLTVVMDRCLKVEHARFHGGLHLLGFDTGQISSRKLER